MAGESLIIGNGNWGVKSGNLLGYNLINSKYVPRELTFARATIGTRTNGALLVEEVPYNLFQYSEQFDNVYWEKGSGLYINSNFSAAPTGLITSDKVTFTGNGAFFINQTFINLLLASTTYTYSIYVKNIDSAGYLGLGIGGGLNESVWFNMTTMQISSATSGVTGTVQQINDGWYRLTVTGITGSVLNNNYALLIHSDTPQTAFFPNVVNSNKSILVWGAQLVFGSSDKTYLPTTTRLNIPRIDYSTGTAALLMEPQRTNIVLRSEEFDSVSWAKSGATVIANDTTAPSGLLAADRITQSGAAINFNQSISLPAGVVTFTTYVKKGNFDSGVGFNFGFFSTVTGDVGYINFNFATGTTSIYSGTFVSHSATNVGNGWYRIQGTINIPSAGATYFYNGATGLNIAGVGSYYYSWGAQVEVGSYPTSYIPTTSATVTRNNDSLVQSGISNFIGQAEGTLYIDVTMNSTLNTDLILIGNSTGVLYDIYIYTGSNKITAAVINSSAYLWTSTMPADFVVGVSYRCAIAYKSGSLAFYINGVQIGTSSATFTPSTIMNRFQLNEQLYAGKQSVIVRSAKLFTSRLSNSELEDLTIGTLDPDAVAFFNRVATAGGSLTTTEQTAVDTLVKSMKANGTWSSMQAVYPMVGGSAAACAQNLKSASFTGTFSSGWTFASTGITGNGTSSFMDTGLNQSVNLTNSSLHSSYYINNGTSAGTNGEIGIANNSTWILIRANVLFNQCDNDFTGPPYSNFGFYCASRTSSSLRSGYYNGSVVNTSLFTVANAVTTYNYYIGALNSGGPAAYFSTYRCAFASIGTGLTATDNTNLYSSIQAFQTTLGRQA